MVRWSRWGIGIAALLVLSVLVNLFMLTMIHPAKAAPDLIGKDVPTLGSATAPVTITEFGDYLCPQCRQFSTSVYPQLKQYIASGNLRFRYIVSPLTNEYPRALPAAMAAYCVGKQQGSTGYFRMHDLLYNTTDFSDKALQADAESLGVNSTQWQDCYTNTTARNALLQNADTLAATHNVRQLPTFFINGQRLVGPQPLSVFAAAINAK